MRQEIDKINVTVAEVLCECNAAVMPDWCSVNPMAPDRGWPRVLRRPIRVAKAFRNGHCGKLFGFPARQVKRATCDYSRLSRFPPFWRSRHCTRLSAGAKYFPSQCSAALNQRQTVAVDQTREKSRIEFPIVYALRRAP
jgi:hypothetical protein